MARMSVDVRVTDLPKVKALIEEVERFTTWQPIETAPTNESVLVFIPNAEHYGPGIYRAMQVDMGTGRRWMTTGMHVGRDCGADSQPTRWMPLPPGPKDEASGVTD